MDTKYNIVCTKITLIGKAQNLEYDHVCGIVRVISDENVKNIKCDINSSILKTMQLPKEKKKKNGRQNITQKILNNAKNPT